jgi:hypothetical protein
MGPIACFMKVHYSVFWSDGKGIPSCLASFLLSLPESSRNFLYPFFPLDNSSQDPANMDLIFIASSILSAILPPNFLFYRLHFIDGFYSQ